ncbi:MAG: hypothetical protein KUG68_10515 [Flavobacteriaceae bacterium]|nr:hypothetical protein [Flavobacteriaceae bacterium]
MHKSILLILIVFIFSCKNNNPPEVSKQVKEEVPVAINFDWLLGDWQRSNEEEGKVTLEHWNKVSDTEYKCLGYTMKEKDTIWRENVSLVKVKEQWSFDVIGMGDSLSTSFIVTEMDTVSFACTNEKNKFPKKISYFKNGTNMRAEISGDGMVIPFEFNKINK